MVSFWSKPWNHASILFTNDKNHKAKLKPYWNQLKPFLLMRWDESTAINWNIVSNAKDKVKIKPSTKTNTPWPWMNIIHPCPDFPKTSVGWFGGALCSIAVGALHLRPIPECKWVKAINLWNGVETCETEYHVWVWWWAVNYTFTVNCDTTNNSCPRSQFPLLTHVPAEKRKKRTDFLTNFSFQIRQLYFWTYALHYVPYCQGLLSIFIC